jgi:hypothetical protein
VEIVTCLKKGIPTLLIFIDEEDWNLMESDAGGRDVKVFILYLTRARATCGDCSNIGMTYKPFIGWASLSLKYASALLS